ncbi:unnamed protein product [marine sediment metagenome]|uniref:Uncharacterized protein n=1 Tax=marine sediment metagenome TaxID=412755 RepID=X1SE84_9ZZZZ
MPMSIEEKRKIFPPDHPCQGKTEVEPEPEPEPEPPETED